LIRGVCNDANDIESCFGAGWWVLVLLFSYLNFSGWWLLKFMGAEFNVVLMILAGLPQWIALSGIVGGVVSLVRIKKAALPPNENDVAISI
jgi:hypothetical protein